jgi:hypothetical protein
MGRNRALRPFLSVRFQMRRDFLIVRQMSFFYHSDTVIVSGDIA